MAKPRTKAELVQYCLRKCGHPVVEINVDELQVDDRIQDALDEFQDYHFDFIRTEYLVHTLTQEEMDQRYITLPPQVTGVYKVFRVNDTGRSTTPLFNIEYQLRMNDLYDLSSVKLGDYYIAKMYLALLDNILNVDYLVRYRKDEMRLYIDSDWETRFKVGQPIVIECGLVLEPENLVALWGHNWFRQYAAALIKKQWGDNILKMSGIKLPSGVMLNAQGIIDQADKEIEYIRKEFIMRFQEPDGFLCG